jgi:hypothetical protein
MGMRLWVQCRAYRHHLASRPRHHNRSAREVGCSDVTSKGRAHARFLDLLESCTDTTMPLFVTCIILLRYYVVPFKGELSKVRVRGVFSPASRPVRSTLFLVVLFII